MSNAPTKLESCCPVCQQISSLSRCQACKVVFYCGREHQAVDRPSHREACNAIKLAHKRLALAEHDLRADANDNVRTWPGVDLFVVGVGRFWGIYETRPYMQARYALVEALLKFKTRAAVQAAFDHIMDMLRLCRGDNLGLRDCAPALYLRLGDEQGCYDFATWWATMGNESTYDWGNMDLPYLNVKGSDVFEEPVLFSSGSRSLAITVSMTLLKIRLLNDVKSLEASTVLVGKSPQEILDNIRGNLVSSAVKNRKDIMESEDHELLIATLQAQIKSLYEAANKQNRHFWAALLNPGSHLAARPHSYSIGSVEEMQLKLQGCYDAWMETPGAIEMIRELRS